MKRELRGVVGVIRLLVIAVSIFFLFKNKLLR